MSAENITRILQSVGKGRPSTHIVRPCRLCGQEAEVPEVIPTSMHHLAACKSCVDADRAAHDAKLVELQKPNPDRLIEMARIPDLPPVPLRPAFARFLEVPETEKAGLYAYGRPGVGKSCQVAEFARQWCRTKFRQAFYVNEVDLFQILKDWKHNTETYNTLCNVPLLAVDDLGANKVSEWSSSVFYAVLDARSAKKRKTILASNLPPAELQKLPGFDERVMRRIRHLCEVPYELSPYTEV